MNLPGHCSLVHLSGLLQACTTFKRRLSTWVRKQTFWIQKHMLLNVPKSDGNKTAKIKKQLQWSKLILGNKWGSKFLSGPDPQARLSNYVLSNLAVHEFHVRKDERIVSRKEVKSEEKMAEELRKRRREMVKEVAAALVRSSHVAKKDGRAF